MAIDAVSGSGATNLQANSLGMEDFLKILLTQLTYQDPLKPMDNQQFMRRWRSSRASSKRSSSTPRSQP